MHWYLVISLKEAKIYFREASRGLKLIDTIHNPLGDVSKRSLVKREAGLAMKSIGRQWSARYSLFSKKDPVEEAMEQFARQITRTLRIEKLHGNVDTFTIYADAKLLGKLRSAIDTKIAKSVVQWIDKDLAKLPKNKLADVLLSKSRA